MWEFNLFYFILITLLVISAMATQGIIYSQVLTVMGYCVSRDCTVHQWQRRQPPMPWCKQQNIPAASWISCPSLSNSSWPLRADRNCWLLLMPSGPKCFILCGNYSFPPEFWWWCRSETKPTSFQSMSWTFSKSLKTQLLWTHGSSFL